MYKRQRPGYTRSERSVGNSFDALFKGCEERIIVTTFASNVDRLQQIIDVAARYGRRVAVKMCIRDSAGYGCPGCGCQWRAPRPR